MKQRTKEILVYIINIFFCVFYFWIFLQLKYKTQWFYKFIVFLVNLFPNKDIGEVIISVILVFPCGVILRAINEKILWKRF